jgi:hypothetical protein
VLEWVLVFSGCEFSVGFQERLKGGQAVGHEGQSGILGFESAHRHKGWHTRAHKIENILGV